MKSNLFELIQHLQKQGHITPLEAEALSVAVKIARTHWNHREIATMLYTKAVSNLVNGKTVCPQ